MAVVVAIVAVALGLWGLVALIFRQGSRRAGLVMMAGAVALVFHLSTLINQEARELGFESAADREAARAAYHAADNDLKRGATRADRRKQLCRILRGRRARNWVGTLTRLTTSWEGQGRGVVSISIGEDVTVRTWDNTFFDMFQGTLIDPDSEILRTLANLQIGDRIKFSGRFFQSPIDCVHEASLTLRGSMADPEFIIRLTSVHVP